MARLGVNLERRFDNYAILYCFSNEPTEVNKKVAEFIRRIRVGKKVKYKCLVYYKNQRQVSRLVKKQLEDFARSYECMNQRERIQHDEVAMSFITDVFSVDTENVFYLIDYYNQMKSQIK